MAAKKVAAAPLSRFAAYCYAFPAFPSYMSVPLPSRNFNRLTARRRRPFPPQSLGRVPL